MVSSSQSLILVLLGYLVLVENCILGMFFMSLQLQKNLSKFTKDNEVFVEFYSSYCLVKDKSSKAILLQGMLKDGLYRLPPSISTSLNSTEDLAASVNHQLHDNNSVPSFSTCILPLVSTNNSKCLSSCALSACQPCLHCNKFSVTAPNSVNTVTEYNSENVSSFCFAYDINKMHGMQSFPAQRTDVMLWHRRLRHPNSSVLTKILTDLKVPHSSKTDYTFCQACQFGKLKQSIYPRSSSQSAKPLDLIYLDLWGPSPVSSPERFKYYIQFLDDHSRFTWIFPLKNKSETYSIFTQFHKLVERQFSSTSKCVQTDWGGEFRVLHLTLLNMVFLLGTRVHTPTNKMVE
ncbi:uncharacterized protein LOC116114998 [Pistacia vera]|uniref:uncharacterized protein LOC116114998 n=1 Tax=Pistacia vera TaxID=55513 RepID=UPI0012631CC1|nr:uncharacterized protein LOC116114998 [Pistacia vera]